MCLEHDLLSHALDTYTPIRYLICAICWLCLYHSCILSQGRPLRPEAIRVDLQGPWQLRQVDC